MKNIQLLLLSVLISSALGASAATANSNGEEEKVESCKYAGYCAGFGLNLTTHTYQYFVGYHLTCDGHQTNTYKNGEVDSHGPCEAGAAE
jgi:hypothetical protein